MSDETNPPTDTGWRIFQGNQRPHDGIRRLPDPPPWRDFLRGRDGDQPVPSLPPRRRELPPRQKERGETYRVPQGSEEVELVNAALYLRRPLLITGTPGTGKSSLAYKISYELELGPVLYWPITTRSTLQEGLYRYDALARLQDAQSRAGTSESPDVGQYVVLGPLGTAFVPSPTPRVLLIDEIDKSDIDLPNDLLNIFEEGFFEIPELVRSASRQPEVTVRTADDEKVRIREGRVQCTAFPLVILTSNQERDFPPAFLRRCLQLKTKLPTEEDLARIIEAHLGQDIMEEAQPLVEQFLARRHVGELATDQLLNAVYLVTRAQSPTGQDRDFLVNTLMRALSQIESI